MHIFAYYNAYIADGTSKYSTQRSATITGSVWENKLRVAVIG